MPVLSLLGGEHGREVIEGVLDLPKQSAFGSEAYVGVHTKAAALLRSIVLNHPFKDGNKRMGLAGALVFLLINEQVCCAYDDELVEFTIGVAAGEVRSLGEIAAWLDERSISIEDLRTAVDDGGLEELVRQLPGGESVAARPLLSYLVTE